MCKVYNSVGSLTAIREHFYQHNIKDLQSLDDLILFRKNYTLTRNQLIAKHEILVEAEKSKLEEELIQIERTISEEKGVAEKNLKLEIIELEQKLDRFVNAKPAGFIIKFYTKIRKWNCQRLLNYRKGNFDGIVEKEIRIWLDYHREKNNRYQFIHSSFSKAVAESSLIPLKELDRTKQLIDEINNSIYGAIGEQKIVEMLEVLSDDYILINDFKLSFSPAVYWPQENEYIKSIQVDHILISSAGVFLIETKNWSEKSINNLDLRSPVEQIQRTSFVLFKMLSDAVTKRQIHLNPHHWGFKKIPMRNLIVLINSCPPEEFQFVKLLTVKDLPGYVKYFKPLFSRDETQKIADYFLSF